MISCAEDERSQVLKYMLDRLAGPEQAGSLFEEGTGMSAVSGVCGVVAATALRGGKASTPGLVFWVDF